MSATETSRGQYGRVDIPRVVLANLFGLAVIVAFWLMSFTAAVLALLLYTLGGLVAQWDDVMSFSRIYGHIRRDGRGSIPDHLEWFWFGNARTVDPAAYKERESSPLWYVALLAGVTLALLLWWAWGTLTPIWAFLVIVMALASGLLVWKKTVPPSSAPASSTS